MDDIFDLEDELSASVASALRIQIKARAFEKLRNSDNAALSVPDLLSKTAGYFVTSYGHNEEAGDALQLALAQVTENSMAVAIQIFNQHRGYEFSPFEIDEAAMAQLHEGAERALLFGTPGFLSI